jgi:hypothetical protein
MMPLSSITPSSVPPSPEITHVRTTVQAGPKFAEVLAGGLGVVLKGATVAASPVSGPLLASAVRLRGAAVTPGASSLSGGVSSGADGDVMQQMKALQQESRDMNLELLGLQEQVQQENRRFSTASNVLKARHDTAKAAIGNIRP